MSAYLHALGSEPFTRNITGVTTGYRIHESPLVRSHSGSKHGAEKHEDLLSSAWHAVSTGVKANVTRVEDGLDAAWNYVAKEGKAVYDYRQHVFQTAYDDLKGVYDYRNKVFSNAASDVQSIYHGAGTVIQTAENLPFAGTIIGGLGGSFLTLAGLVALFLFFKA